MEAKFVPAPNVQITMSKEDAALIRAVAVYDTSIGNIRNESRSETTAVFTRLYHALLSLGV